MYPLSGTGIVATEKGETIVTPGCVVLSPGGEKHWHGATDDSSFTYLYILPFKQETKFWDSSGALQALSR
jgi:quercetin dioxygenase-like cupin family protein